jgi:hypothetical protein
LRSHSSISQHMETESSLSPSQQPSIGHYPVSDQSHPFYPILRSILILSSRLREWLLPYD